VVTNLEKTQQGRVALVTGGSGALGTAVVQAFEEAGISVCRQEPKDPGSPPVRFDVTDSAEVEHGIDNVRRDYGHVDIVANLVGGWRPQGALIDSSVAELQQFIQLNLISAFNVTKAAVPHMVEAGWGRILNIGAMPGEKGAAFNGPYGISKAGLLTMTEALAAELKGTGVTVNAVIPSVIDTAANREGMPDADFSAWVPPADIAAALLYLCSDAGASVTGERLHVLNRA
jgi:NAD(P)-dependent dehydrogenase (short-subunit alcohol dehydrogenase family)